MEKVIKANLEKVNAAIKACEAINSMELLNGVKLINILSDLREIKAQETDRIITLENKSEI